MTYTTVITRNSRIRRLYELRDAITAEIEKLETEAIAARDKHGNWNGAKVAKCGTDSGYYRHHRTDKTPPCNPCREAHNLAERRRVAKAKERAEMNQLWEAA